jgi:hypothetical protein
MIMWTILGLGKVFGRMSETSVTENLHPYELGN